MVSRMLYDILLPVFEILQREYDDLYRCSLVNRDFNEIATKFLYSEVVLSPLFRPVLHLKDQNGPSGGQLVSSCLPGNAAHVQTLEISGFLSPRPASRNTIGIRILHAVQSYRNLKAVQISPKTFPTGCFTDTLRALSMCLSLQRLTVNSSCTDEVGSSALVTIGGLKYLALMDPTRAILNILPGGLSRLSGSLTELHLEENCGSITPAVLRSFLPFIRHCVRSITLGLSYSLTDDDVFSFLNEMPELTTVQLHYYLQLKIPAPTLHLPSLRSFTAKHAQMHTREDVNHFCAWVRRAISSSHNLQSLRLLSSTDESSASVSFDGLINHLTTRHFGTLAVLNLGSGFIGGPALKQLCAACTRLENLSAGVAWETLLTFSMHGYASTICRLHTVSFNIKNVKRRKIALDTQKATEIIMQGLPYLRRLTVNDVQWEGSWECRGLEPVFVVREVVQPKTRSNKEF